MNTEIGSYHRIVQGFEGVTRNCLESWIFEGPPVLTGYRKMNHLAGDSPREEITQLAASHD
jgi:hypothetical protein